MQFIEIDLSRCLNLLVLDHCREAFYVGKYISHEIHIVIYDYYQMV